jgi:cold shock CspA family protein
MERFDEDATTGTTGVDDIDDIDDDIGTDDGYRVDAPSATDLPGLLDPVHRAENASTMYIGRVLWYDFDKGIGFIQLVDSRTGEVVQDVFVHRSQIHAPTVHPTARKLITGEFVNFETVAPQPGKNQPQAMCVRGLFDGPLICEHGAVEFTSYTNVLSGGRGALVDTRAKRATDGGDARMARRRS